MTFRLTGGEPWPIFLFLLTLVDHHFISIFKLKAFEIQIANEVGLRTNFQQFHGVGGSPYDAAVTVGVDGVVGASRTSPSARRPRREDLRRAAIQIHQRCQRLAVQVKS